jgi:hypothetical protein
MTLAHRVERWLTRANWARYRGNDRVANYCMRRARRALVESWIKGIAKQATKETAA